MTIDEAIEILSDILLFVQPGDPPEEHIALQLGIEALERVKETRPFGKPDPKWSLPGETED